MSDDLSREMYLEASGWRRVVVAAAGLFALLWADTRRAARALERDMTARYGVKRDAGEPMEEFVSRCLARADRAVLKAVDDLTAHEIATARAEAYARRGYHAGDA